MKTLFKNILVLAVMLGTLTSYANETSENPTISSNVSKGDYISVSDEAGKIIYSGLVNQNGNLHRLYDFSQLKNGTYTVEISKDFEIEINAVKVENNIVTFENSNTKIFKPVFRSEDSRLLISKLAVDSDEMTVDIYYKNDLIHSENVKGKDVLNRVYRLDNTFVGDYTAVIKANGREFVKHFKI